jgi:hypothetical protein
MLYSTWRGGVKKNYKNKEKNLVVVPSLLYIGGLQTPAALRKEASGLFFHRARDLYHRVP